MDNEYVCLLPDFAIFSLLHDILYDYNIECSIKIKIVCLEKYNSSNCFSYCKGLVINSRAMEELFCICINADVVA